MKLLTLLVTLAGLALGGIAWRAALGREPEAGIEIPRVIPRTLAAEVPAGHVVRTFDVEGMCCETCPTKLYGPLARIEGVLEIAIDPDAGRVATVVPAELDVALLTDALNRDEYTAKLAE